MGVKSRKLAISEPPTQSGIRRVPPTDQKCGGVTFRAREGGNPSWFALPQTSRKLMNEHCRALARSLAALTFISGVGRRMQEAARTRSPSISTMQARQLPWAR